MGASLFVLMATMSFEPRMPAMCWICPDTPHAMYAFGLMAWPLSPIQCSSPSHFRSASMGRLQPTAPPGKHAANCSASLMSPCDLKPRPTPTTTCAEPRSKSECDSCALPTTFTLLAGAAPANLPAGWPAPSNVLPMTEQTAFGPMVYVAFEFPE